MLLGLVFTEFVDMVETAFSPETVDLLLEKCESGLASGGAYTTIGNYSHEEMLFLVRRLSEITQVPADELIRRYGKHLFGCFFRRYPFFFGGIGDSFQFLERVEHHIHDEVRKLYPQSQPPALECRRLRDGRLQVDYRSERPLALLAHGLIEGCIEHFGERVSVGFEPLDGSHRLARFVLERVPKSMTAARPAADRPKVPAGRAERRKPLPQPA